MSSEIIVDSSIAMKWLNEVDENNIEKANKLLNDALEGKVNLLMPELAKYEIGNALLKKKQLIPSEANISLGTIHSLPITFVSESEELAKQTYNFAFNCGVTYYDASFMSLAKQYDALLITENIKHQGKSKEIQVKTLSQY